MKSLLIAVLVIFQCISAYSPLKSSSLKFRSQSVGYNRLGLSSTNSNFQFNAKDLLISDCKGLTRGEINEFVLQLEKQNPTSDPAYSPLVNGVWEVLTTGIASPGMIGFQAIKALPGDFIDASDVTITISSAAPRVKAETFVKIGFSKINVSIITNIVAKSGLRLTETYESGKIGVLDVPLTNINLFTRDLLITYLDEDLLIARDPLGTPEILRRKDYSAVRPDGGDSSSQTEIPSA
eukprot:gene5289-5672_t